mmetsp:Transcript_119001/g.370678  ORF Transcript_119001/g.370678 Transcript_119001/m.370678 type:complete len:272 (-) Transcript_119001:767-1582(-)
MAHHAPTAEELSGRSVEDIRAVVDAGQVQRPQLRKLRGLAAAQPHAQVVIQVLQDGLLVQLHEGGPDDPVQPRCVASVCPEGVVDAREGQALPLAALGDHHHVRRIQGVDEVRREPHALLDLLHVAGLAMVERDPLLVRMHPHLLLLLVWLGARESDRRDPGRRHVRLVEERRDVVKPDLDLHGCLKHLVYGLQHKPGQVRGQGRQLLRGHLVGDQVPEVVPHLLLRANPRDPVADGHHRLLHHLPLEGVEADEAASHQAGPARLALLVLL